MAGAGAHTLLVGVDGGATEVRAFEVVQTGGWLALGPARAAFRHERVAGFEPRPLAAQSAQRERGVTELDAPEVEQGLRWIESYAAAIESVVARAHTAPRGAGDSTSGLRVRIGACAPGLKSADGRSLEVVKNGPRIAGFVGRLEARLARVGLVPEAPIPALLSDGVAAGLGEQATAEGGFAPVRSAYYLGGGTGLAECCLLEGRVVSMDELSGTCEKAWALASSSGEDYEAHLSARGLVDRYVAFGGRAGTFPEEAARAGEPAALRVFEECARMFAELVDRRVNELSSARGVQLERVVVGARLGVLFGDPALEACLRRPAERATRIPVFVSALREAPAIGAARWALEEGPHRAD